MASSATGRTPPCGVAPFAMPDPCAVGPAAASSATLRLHVVAHVLRQLGLPAPLADSLPDEVDKVIQVEGLGDDVHDAELAQRLLLLAHLGLGLGGYHDHGDAGSVGGELH